MPTIWPPKTSRRFKKTFRNKRKLEEMLNLARSGIPHAALSRMYDVDHQVIYYHCRKNKIKVQQKKCHQFIRGALTGVTTDKDITNIHVIRRLKKDIQRFFKKGETMKSVADIYGVDVNVVINYCEKNEIDYKGMYMAVEKKKEKLFKPKAEFPRWMDDNIEGHICRGKTAWAREEEQREREKNEKKRQRLELLSY